MKWKLIKWDQWKSWIVIVTDKTPKAEDAILLLYHNEAQKLVDEHNALCSPSNTPTS